MFYLKELARFSKNNLFGQILFSILTMTLVVAVSNYNHFEAKISRALPSMQNEYYFNALVDGDLNTNSITRKIKGLPGVKAIESISASKNLNVTKQLKDVLDLDKNEITEVISMKGLKIILDEKVSESSTNLIREYLVRLTGKDNVVLGGIRKKISNHQSWKEVMTEVKRRPLQVAIVVLSIFWIVAFVAIRKDLKQVSYLIEKFQRKKNVALKMYLTNILIWTLFGIVISFAFFAPNEILVATICALLISTSALYTLGKLEWQKA
ncbi:MULTISPECIES: hypothetical protein [Halobacteriovorax]|uniref:Cell division protein FtsX n=1 Tax=Halobacteriovorax vibrionivorans TaxID=2152716 RepID=A0ABY0ILY7_9BACT|nr:MULTISPECIES: hypothetical protein [Halobacteriovorax]AYF45460.1 hypothetical protein BALOs_2463 [Halobacteriovorax sp. BALOs_7]RZF22539.1 hypothetical protein DAY19_01855 [Halobacteriovorax vibrionivorans]TGD47731.1 hypothetical protein EP118_07220 [Halobacteriovorax sp. Y22]